MKHPIKLIINKLGKMKYTWVKYYQMEKLLLEEHSHIQTEAQLCYYVYQRYGEGRYQMLAFKKGHKGFWIYWLGNLYENGFIRDIRKNTELERLQKLHSRAKTYEERQDIEEDMDFEKEISKETKTVRRGVTGLQKSKAGILHPYEEIY